MNAAMLHENLVNQAQRDAEAIAFRCVGQSLSYGELDDRSSRLAQALAQDGVQRGDRVAVRLPPGLESPIAVYGVLKAGAAMVPIDPLAPPSRVSELLRAGSIRQMITSSLDANYREGLAQSPLQTVIGCEGDDRMLGVSWSEIDA